MGENYEMSDFKQKNLTDSVIGHEVPFVVTTRKYSRGFVERTGYFLARSDFAIPGPSKRRTSKELEGVERSDTNIAATRRNLRRLIYSLSPDRMLTMTYKENVIDLDQAKRDFKLFKDSFSKQFPLSAFVAVPEQQKRGAWHFHVALRGYFSIKTLRRWWPHGHIQIDYQKRKLRDSVAKVGAYLSKYLGKDLKVLGRAAYSVCNRKNLDMPIKTVVRLRLGAADGLPIWAKLEAIFKHNAVAAFAYNGIYWRLDHG
jgi:hypothetical protein